MVAARETTLQELLEGSKQYQVPLYQRHLFVDARPARAALGRYPSSWRRTGSTTRAHALHRLAGARAKPHERPAGVSSFWWWTASSG